MRTLTAEELNRQPQQLVASALRGEVGLITSSGEPIFITVPLGKGLRFQRACLELVATLLDREQISLGLAARIAGLSHSDMIDELGRRGVATIRLGPGDLARELAASAAPPFSGPANPE